MVRLNVSDERVFGELQNRLYELKQTLTPTTDRFAPIDGTVRQLQERLSHYDPTLRICVIGHRNSGKSSLINAIMGVHVLPPDTTRELMILPFDGEPVLRKVAGKAIAIGPNGVCEHLVSEHTQFLEELADRRLHTRLPLIKGNTTYAANWAMIDTSRGTTGVCPKLSSVASRIYSPNIFVGDVMFYCVNATYLGTEREDEVLSYMVGDLDVWESTLNRFISCTTFVLTFTDVIGDFEDGVNNIHSKTEPAIHSRAALKAHFIDLVKRKLSVDIPADHVLLVSARNMLLCKKILSQEKPEMNDVYEYCELMYGSDFMQTVDKIPENDLYVIVKGHARSDGARKNGIRELDNLLRLIDFNSVRFLMKSVTCTAMESTEQLLEAMRQAGPLIQLQVSENTEELNVLISELENIISSAEMVEEAVTSIFATLVDLVNDEMHKFFSARLEELAYVLDHKELAWFRQSQIPTVADMATSLKKLEAFTMRYQQHRRFLLDKAAGGKQSESQWSFLNGNEESIFKVMENEKRELVIDFGGCFAHHLKDEFTLFRPNFIETVNAKVEALIQMVAQVCKAPLEQTAERLKVPFDFEEAVMELRELALIEQNDRRINNCFRDIPQHVATAAVELSIQYNGVSDKRYREKQQRKAKELEKIAAAAEADTALVVSNNDTNNSSSINISSVHDASAGYNKYKDASKMPPEELTEELQYLHEAWQLALSTVQIHQLATYNVHHLDDIIRELNANVLGYIRRYAQSLEEGITEQKRLISEAASDALEVQQVCATVTPLVTKYDLLIDDLESLIIMDVETAETVAHRE